MAAPLPADFAPRRILIVRLSALGDVLRVLPLLPPLQARFPAAALDWITEPAGHGLLQRLPSLHRVLRLPRQALRRDLTTGRWLKAAGSLRQVRRDLREARYDLVLDAQGTYKSGFLAWLTGSSLRLGYAAGSAREYLPWAATLKVEARGRISRVEKGLRLAAPLGIDPALAAWDLPSDPGAAAEAERLWQAAGPRPRILMSPGTSERQSYKRWPAERFGELARHMQDAGMAVRIAWGPGEEEQARVAGRSAGESSLVLPPTSLSLLAELTRQADLFVGNDSGPMHLAALVKTRVVALFGATDPALNAPWGVEHTVVDALPEAGGSPRPRTPDVMRRIGVPAVESAVRSLLAH